MGKKGWRLVSYLGALALAMAVVTGLSAQTRMTADQGAPTKGKSWSIGHAPNSLTTTCTELVVPAQALADGGTFRTLVFPNTWYQMFVSGDGNGGFVGCWSNLGVLAKPQVDSGVANNVCFGLPKVKDGTDKPESFDLANTSDAGALNGYVQVYWYATTAYTVTLCVRDQNR